MKEIYDRRITDPSLEELKELALWYNEKIGNYPVIVGGWAVYFYTHGLGSKDIDVIFAGDKVKHQTLFAYFLTHGFKEKPQGLFDKSFSKKIMVDGEPVEIIVDATSQERIITFERREARLPWAWAFKHIIEHKIGNAIIYIPELELLLVYKLGAILGRNEYVKAGVQVDYYASKIWKDVYDVLSLSALEVDATKFGKFFHESKLDKYKDEIMEIIEDNFNDEMKSMLKGADLSRIREILAGRRD